MNPYKSSRFLSCVCVFKAGGGYTIYSCKNSACKVRFTPSRSLKSHFCIEVTLFLIPMHIPCFILQKKDWHKSRDYLSVWACVRVTREFVCTSVGVREKISVGKHNTVNKAKHKLGPVSTGSVFCALGIYFPYTSYEHVKLNTDSTQSPLHTNVLNYGRGLGPLESEFWL